MTIEEAKNILINRGFVEINGDQVFDGNKWRNAITVISKWLEQESCEDCISRKAVIDAIYANGVWENEYNLTSSRIKKAVESLPSVTPKEKTGWIPVSERLPEENKNNQDGGVWRNKVLITGYLNWLSEKEAFITTAFARDVRNKCVTDINVIAWMPYPEIYKESEE